MIKKRLAAMLRTKWRRNIFLICHKYSNQLKNNSIRKQNKKPSKVIQMLLQTWYLEGYPLTSTGIISNIGNNYIQIDYVKLVDPQWWLSEIVYRSSKYLTEKLQTIQHCLSIRVDKYWIRPNIFLWQNRNLQNLSDIF